MRGNTFFFFHNGAASNVEKRRGKETPDGVNNCYCFFLVYFFFLGESKNCFKALKRCSNQLKPESVVNLKAQGVCESSFASVSFPVAAIQGSDESNVREKGFVSALH